MKRTPKNYQGTLNTTKKIAPLLADFLRERFPENACQKTAIFNAWYAIMGPRMRDLTSPVSFQDGALTVSVKTHTLYAFLSTHEKARLLQELQKKLGKSLIKTIRFRIGSSSMRYKA
ncbi:MAG: DUF721 domain-containing protein [Chlamydiota bacterium]